MPYQQHLRGDPLPWLLQPDDPGPRYLALRHLLDRCPSDPELRQARAEAHTHGPIATILGHMSDEGYWAEPGAGYLPKYRGTVWSLIALAQLGARAEEDERITTACAYFLGQAFNEGGQISRYGAPSATADCLQGNMLASFLDLGFDDPRLPAAFDWMARTVTGEGVAPAGDRHAPVRYYSGKYGPDFACGSNNKLSCAWGGAKVMLALGKLPPERRTPVIERAIERGVDFFFSTDPARADYPSGYSDKPSGNWWKLGFPVFYVTDILQILEALAPLGHAADPRLDNAYALVLAKQDASGCWPLEYDYAGKTWADFGTRKQPNKWVTLRVLRALKARDAAGAAAP